ncbi:MAG: tetratricopeptide repeat protein, partial [Propionibacteriales bacterium]|nr:tetratricopeptide repeat protein [Propionibacteriales bacterium]
MLTAEKLHARALRASERGRHAEARHNLRRALERADNPVTRARILLSLGYQEAERGHVDEGLHLLDEAADANLPSAIVGLIASQRGLLLMRAGREDAALAAFDEAVRLLDEDDALALTRAALNRGNVHLQRRDLRAARADFERAVDVADRHTLTVQRAMAMHNLGYTDLLAGDLPSALRRMDEVFQELASLSPVSEAVCHVDRAQVLVAAGLLTEADGDLAAAATAFGSRKLRQDQAEAELARSRLALAQLDLSKAERLARQAQLRFLRRGSESWALQADLVRLAARVAAGKSPAACQVESMRLAAE